MKTLVTFRKNWADEFDVHGFCICKTSLEETMKFYKEQVYGKSFWFGTNQGWDEDDHSPICETDFTFKVLSDAEYDVFNRLFQGTHFGHCP